MFVIKNKERKERKKENISSFETELDILSPHNFTSLTNSL